VEPRYDLPKAAPQPLRKVQLFVNTVDAEHEREWLSTPSDLTALLAELGLDAGGRATARELERATALREALRALLHSHADGAPPPPPALAVINGVATEGQLTVEFDERDGIRFAARATSVPGALATLVGIVAAARLDGSGERLKACRKCGWAFYDYSRNRTAGWCSMAICGNRQKTRRYRERRAAAQRAH
jgi:predicted RNA-binding Zn ribbon-like protein